MDDNPKPSISEKFKRLLRRKNAGDEEMLAVVDEFKKQGVIEEDEAEMISNVMEFSDTTAADICTHRSKIVAISSEETVESALKIMLEENHSRYPMYDDNVDNIKGMLYSRDLMVAYMEGKGAEQVTEFARDALFVPETMHIDALFEKLRDKRTHIAVVVDEYGQTEGLVGMEDVIEELVGDIFDEFDDADDNVTKRSEGLFSFNSDTRLEEAMDMLGIEAEEQELENYETLNGLLISLLGHIPVPHERAEITYKGYLFKILSKEGRVISDVIVSRLN